MASDIRPRQKTERESVPASGELFASVILDGKLHCKIAGTAYGGFTGSHLRKPHFDALASRIDDPRMIREFRYSTGIDSRQFIPRKWNADPRNKRSLRKSVFTWSFNYFFRCTLLHLFVIYLKFYFIYLLIRSRNEKNSPLLHTGKTVSLVRMIHI